METFRDLAQKIAATPASEWFGVNSWVIPISQSIHIICVGVIIGSATIISMRLLGIGRPARSVTQTVNTHAPWIYRALIGLLCTGIVQTVAEPLREFVTPQFWWKMLLIVVVLAMTIAVSRAVHANPARWDAAASRPDAAKAFAVLSVVIWATIVVLGRLIGYTWADYA